MKLSLRKTSLNDYPGRISSVFFFSGCNLRCPWCHNGELVLGTSGDLVSLEEGLAHLKKRRQVLSGVVLSGGEPCLYKELGELIKEIKKIGLPVKLDTNGMCHEALEKLFSGKETSPDYIAIDLKIAPERYVELRGSPELLIKSAELVKKSGVAHEYRTIALPASFIGENDIEALAPLTDGAPWYFRLFRGGNCLDNAWNNIEEDGKKAFAFAETLAAKARDLGRNAFALTS